MPMGSIPACAGEPHPRRNQGADQWVYPRVCGGTPATGVLDMRRPGLSPRVRGNHRAADRDYRLPGSIPACAGEPPCRRSRLSPSRVYPRVCGGTKKQANGGLPIFGLSPRVRGNPVGAYGAIAGPGSIPACAGEPILPSRVASAIRVYPRVCGGTLDRGRMPTSNRGLSPRVRGNLPYQHETLPLHRSIPACAGEPLSCCCK